MITIRQGSRYDEGSIYDDGYDWMDRIAEKGWVTLGAWGEDGWDLGSWPLVIYAIRKHGGRFEAVHHCEGDLTYISADTAEERDAWIDYSALWDWLNRGTPEGLDALLADHVRVAHGIEPVDGMTDGPHGEWHNPWAVFDQHRDLHGGREAHTYVEQLDWLPARFRGRFSWARLDERNNA